MVVVCLTCELGLRVMPVHGSDRESDRELDMLVGKNSEFWPNKYPCPRCSKPATGMSETMADPKVFSVLEMKELTPQEAFAAFNGLGFPDEQVCTFEMVKELLTTHPIRRVVGSTVSGTERTLIDSLELWDGTKIHLGASTEGAIVYRIVRPLSYVAKEFGDAG